MITFALWYLLNQMDTTEEFWENYSCQPAYFISETIERKWSQLGLLWLSDFALLCLYDFKIPERGYSEHSHLYECYFYITEVRLISMWVMLYYRRSR
jgi:hypothetical protein